MTQKRMFFAAGTVAVLAAAGIGYLAGSTTSPSEQPAPPAAVSPSAEPTSGTTDQSAYQAVFDRDDLTWKLHSGIVEIPFSRAHGPRVTEGGWSRGFARTPQGAVLAAIHIIFQTNGGGVPRAAQEAALAEQVVGAEADHYRERSLASAGPAEGIERVVLEGYRIISYTEHAAKVEFTTAAVKEQVERAGTTVDLVWQDGDWRMVAPSLETLEGFRVLDSLDGFIEFPR